MTELTCYRWVKGLAAFLFLFAAGVSARLAVWICQMKSAGGPSDYVRFGAFCLLILVVIFCLGGVFTFFSWMLGYPMKTRHDPEWRKMVQDHRLEQKRRRALKQMAH